MRRISNKVIAGNLLNIIENMGVTGGSPVAPIGDAPVSKDRIVKNNYPKDIYGASKTPKLGKVLKPQK